MLLETPSLLIADDDRAFRETLRDLFELRGYRALVAEDGVEAFGIVRQEPVHVLLLDMHMPEWSGLETIRRLHAAQVRLPWILMSAALDDSIVREAREAEAFSILPKPVRCAELTSVVSQALKLRLGI